MDNVIFNVFAHWLEPKTFAQCTSCFTPMLGRACAHTWKTCYHCKQAEEFYAEGLKRYLKA